LHICRAKPPAQIYHIGFITGSHFPTAIFTLYQFTFEAIHYLEVVGYYYFPFAECIYFLAPCVCRPQNQLEAAMVLSALASS
jgi:hypothetical protein